MILRHRENPEWPLDESESQYTIRSTVPQGHPLHSLDDDDLEMVTAFVLASGSIKDLAERYGVSYPTMRQRLDELIERLRRRIAERGADPVEQLLGDLVSRGRLSSADARRVREAHRNGLRGPGRKDGSS